MVLGFAKGMGLSDQWDHDLAYRSQVIPLGSSKLNSPQFRIGSDSDFLGTTRNIPKLSQPELGSITDKLLLFDVIPPQAMRLTP